MRASPSHAWTPRELEALARAKLHAAIRAQRPAAAAAMARELYRLLRNHGFHATAPEPKP